MRPHRLSLTLLAVGALACADSPSPTAPWAASLPTADAAARRITVMTRNLYIGADVDRVIGALVTPDPADDLPALLGALAVVEATDLPSRLAAVADEIARHRPHVVGVQEVYQLDVDLTPLGIPAPVIHQDFLALLEAALDARGLDYVVAAKVQNTVATPLPGVSLFDHDVILIDNSRARLEQVLAANTFQANVGPISPGVTLLRGYVAASIAVGGRAYTIVNTHLESGTSAQIAQLRAAQALELAAVVGSRSPVILMGDLNDHPGSPMHQVLAGAGLTDVWASLHTEGPGFTCCHAEDLSNERQDFTQRIDYVWTRGTGGPNGKVQGNVRRTGLLPPDRIAGPFFRIWPSDHAGIVAELLTPRP